MAAPSFAVFWNYKSPKLNASAIYWEFLELKLSTKFFDSIFRKNFKSQVKNFSPNYKSEKFPEDGKKNFVESFSSENRQ
jgi:hypothetical protein